ncbi:MAG: ABC transporter ATP-binding protein [Eggerthellaceae bacterium]|nr:ABC transporter ATP-binding protein [Eggerthellaceae bacterium]
MWKYLKRYLPFALLAVLSMLGDAGADLIQPLLMAEVVDEGILAQHGPERTEFILKMGIDMILVALGGGIAGSLCNLFTHLASQKTGNLIRQDCFARIMSLSFEQIDHLGAGTLITRLTNDITQVQGLLAMFMRMLVRMTLFVAGSIALLFSLDAHFGIIALIACPLMASIVISCLKRTSPLFDRLQTRIDAVNDIMREDITGLRTIKAYVREAHEKRRFEKANDDLVETQLSTLLIFALMNPSASAIAYIAIACMLAAGNYDVAAGAIEPGDVMAAISYALLLLQGTLMIVLLSQNISRGIASWKRVKEILALEPDQTDGTATHGLPDAPAFELRNVSFTYPGARKAAVRNVSLVVYPGETIALVGPTGCGKTTLAHLVPRFYDACAGEVLVEGIDVRAWNLIALRNRIAFSFQRPELFNASLHDNITWTAPDASRQQAAHAALVAQADEFISEMPQGFDEPVSERGANLSGGQRQRIALARVALSEADIIILDDATSALDVKTEAAFYAALASARSDATKLIITQRVATAILADRIAVMEKGRILDVGSHVELIKRCASYRLLIESQLAEEEVASLGTQRS